MASHSGRNVCLYYLLGSCKFGGFKCVYSHSKRFLPEVGWWTTEEGRQNCRDNMEIEKEGRREMRAFNQLLGRSYNTGTALRMNAGGSVGGKRQVAVGSSGKTISGGSTRLKSIAPERLCWCLYLTRVASSRPGASGAMARSIVGYVSTGQWSALP